MGVGRPFEVRTNLLLENWLLSPFMDSRVGGYCTEYRFCIDWLLEERADLLGGEFYFSE